MKCPKCGKVLRESKTKKDRFLCDNCKKGYWAYELEDDYEDDYEDEPTTKPKKKHKALKITGIVFAVLIVLGAIGSALGGEEPDSTAEQNVETGSTIEEESISSEVQEEKEEEQPEDDGIPTEYKSALAQAKSYSEIMYMSKQGIYDQLVSEYGGQFSEEAAQYAVDNLEADYKANALEKAKQYQDSMAMSPEAIRDQLTSEYGEQFTQEEADYAVENLP